MLYSTAGLSANVCLQGNYYTPGTACEVTRSGKTLHINNGSNSDTLQAKEVGDKRYAVHAYIDDPTGEGAMSCREGKIKRVMTFLFL